MERFSFPFFQRILFKQKSGKKNLPFFKINKNNINLESEIEKMKEKNEMYYTYMLRCEDNSIYTGIAKNVEQRMKEHFSKDKKCAKYTLTHTPIKLECVFESESRILASKLEFYIKKLSKSQKEEIIKKRVLPEEWFQKIDVNQYRYNSF